MALVGRNRVSGGEIRRGPFPSGEHVARDRPISFDHVAAEYDKTRRLPEEVEGRVVAALAEVVGRGRLLDAGVGTGRWAAPLSARGVPVVGVDVAPRMMDVARSRGAKELLLGDVRRLPLRD